MRILALEPFYGGSHKAFLDGWIAHSRHQFTVLGLPPFKWKWRMRHAAVTFANQLRERPYCEQEFEVVWSSDMLNLAEFLGLAPESVRTLPRVAYFHENQLTYPVRVEHERDLHFAYSNFTTCLAADQIWFNSKFHQADFTEALAAYLARMPDYQAVELVEWIKGKAAVQYPGIDPFPMSVDREAGPIRIVWNGRWEHDKNPNDFFAALRSLKRQDFRFQLIVLGESFRNSPAVFQSAQTEFEAETLHWGYAENVEDYRRLLCLADIVVSTANHEFFGIGIVEAMAAGAIPIVPDRLAYPEVLTRCELPVETSKLLYGQTARDLVRGICTAAELAAQPEMRFAMQKAAQDFMWNTRAAELDRHLSSLS